LPVENDPVLAFDNVTVKEKRGRVRGLCGASFAIHRGELMLVRLAEDAHAAPLADAAQGLGEIEEGSVRFLGQPWQTLAPDAAAALRGKTGRVFESRAWLSNLDLDENVFLAESHHSRRPLTEIKAEALKLAGDFGLSGLGETRCHNVLPPDLRRAEWVRAFLGNPSLLILERPTRDVASHMTAPLEEAVSAACKRGAAVLWITSNPRIWRDGAFNSCLRFALSGPELQPVAETVS